MTEEQSPQNSYVRPTFTLNNFEGPLELLLFLIQKDEMDICDIFLKELTAQFQKEMETRLSVDQGADFLSIASTLLLLKSKRLLPNEETPLSEEIEDPRLSLIEQLLEYCRFKEIAEGLSKKEEEQRVHFPRAPALLEKTPPLGLAEVGLTDLVRLVQDVIEKSEKKARSIIRQEEWEVAPKLDWLKQWLTIHSRIAFVDLFSPDKCKGELIVLFLALLELMKHQNARLIREEEQIFIEKP